MNFLNDLIEASREVCPMTRVFKIKKCYNDWVDLFGTTHTISKTFLELAVDPDGLLKHIHQSSTLKLTEGIKPEITRTFRETDLDNIYKYSITLIRKNKRK